ncbi:YceK/YidQ family lipoprotein [Pseudomonas sp. K2I15]|uniref:YceK/YidQ family lipoprotein n=1 Tax=unclassified Pseudomonas TaxID=196821 RepID=UPI000B4D97E8|nr:YceK/YidQ family lipoprotein [Pseudomonas sp. K2I15]OWP72597.1 YceK/YidQ family lipoprotein [Pseudomonas sp. K2I15]
MELSMSLATKALFAAALVSVAGCGTINTVFRPDAVASQNLKESRSYCENVPRIYSGVIYGFCTLNGAPDSNKDQTRDASGAWPIFAAEFVGSGVLDTLVLPYTIYRQNKDGSIEIFR